MSDNLTDEQLLKMGEAAGHLVLSRRLADVLYAVKVNLPAGDVGKRMAAFCEALDGYVDWRVSGAIRVVLKDLAAELQRAQGEDPRS